MDSIKELLSRLALFCRLETAIAKELENHDSRLKDLETNRKMKDPEITRLQKKVAELDLVIRQMKAGA